MTPDKHLLYNIHKYMLQSLPSAMPAFPKAMFHPSLLQPACRNLASRTELQISWCCPVIFPPWEAANPLHRSAHVCGCAVTQRLGCSLEEGGSPSGLLGARSPTGKQETC